jgi:hypothetical protein
MYLYFFRVLMQVTDFTDNDQIQNVYFPETEKFVKSITNCDKVVVYGCVVRISTSTAGQASQPPAADTHVDFTTKEATSLAHNLLQDTTDPEYQYSRALHVSNWRTWSPTPQDWPLAVIDARTVKPNEGHANSIIEMDVWPKEVQPPYDDLPDLDPAIVTRESTAFPYQPWHKWYYFSDMQKDEVLTFKLHDSDHGRVWRTPHTAFPNDAVNSQPRCSVEIRACAYFK